MARTRSRRGLFSFFRSRRPRSPPRGRPVVDGVVRVSRIAAGFTRFSAAAAAMMMRFFYVYNFIYSVRSDNITRPRRAALPYARRYKLTVLIAYRPDAIRNHHALLYPITIYNWRTTRTRRNPLHPCRHTALPPPRPPRLSCVPCARCCFFVDRPRAHAFIVAVTTHCLSVWTGGSVLFLSSAVWRDNVIVGLQSFYCVLLHVRVRW